MSSLLKRPVDPIDPKKKKQQEKEFKKEVSPHFASDWFAVAVQYVD
jgi:hypothetical protein